MNKIEYYFHKGGDYEWHCPNCNVGLLKVDNEKFQVTETKRSKQSEENYWGEKEITEYLFNGTLNCNHCSDVVSIIGYGDLAHYDQKVNTQDGIEWEPITIDRFYPIFFHPPINLFYLSKGIPITIKKIIIDSFKLFWSDSNASANKARIAIEKIINNVDPNNNNGNLHNKISNSTVLSDKIKNFLLAIKWIGNSGSHKELNVSKNDMIDTYKLLDKSISEIYKDDNELIEISEEINERKKPRNN